MKQKQEKLQKVREKLLNLIKTHPNSPEAAKWKQMLAEIGMHQGAVSRRPSVIMSRSRLVDVLTPTDEMYLITALPLYKVAHTVKEIRPEMTSIFPDSVAALCDAR